MLNLAPLGVNRTKGDSFDALKQARESIGTGLFEVAAPELGVHQNKIVVVPDLAYDECVKRGQNCFGFKWIANDVMQHDAIDRDRRGGCRGMPCPDGECPDPCFCSERMGNICM